MNRIANLFWCRNEPGSFLHGNFLNVSSHGNKIKPRQMEEFQKELESLIEKYEKRLE